MRKGLRSDRETRAAAAGRRRVRIVDPESGADQVVNKVQFRTFQEVERHGINEHGSAVPLDDDVVVGARVVECETVLKPRAPAASDRDPQHRLAILRRKNFRDSAGGAWRHREESGFLDVHRRVPVFCITLCKTSNRRSKVVNGPPGRLLPPLFEPPRALAPPASRPSLSRGRYHCEAESPTRSCYQRDRDRIIHSAVFRRLKHKTQVFVEHEGDYYRTRLTHSLEVAQIARSLARVLGVDEDLAETVSLAHDLGHTPFGHAGEDALNAAAADIGGFDHNAHALRLLTRLEHRYAAFDGLNLTWETLEGLVKHNGPLSPRGTSRPIR